MKNVIVKLGYRPEIVPSRIELKPLDKKPDGAVPDPVPDPIAAAITKARDSNKLVFIDFYAQWCGACKVLDQTTFKDPLVIKTLEGFIFLKVDADIYPDALRYFNIVGMPTLIVLNALGEELYRQVGPISASKLNEELLSIK